jgi:brefeldin A-resistance guanine nucleotide exchange factor 1
MQRTLLSSSLASPKHKSWTAIFSEVLCPLVTQLLKPEVYQSDPLGMSETRVRAADLLSKVFLHYLVLLGEIDSEGEGKNGGKGTVLRELWLRIVGIMDRLIGCGQGGELVSPEISHPRYLLPIAQMFYFTMDMVANATQ